MLKELKITNFVFVEYMQIDFSGGLTVMTGETGAGKSVIAGAIHLVLGEQVKSDLFLDKQKSVTIEATFGIESLANEPLFNNLLQQYDIDSTEGELFFLREIKPDGKSTIFINGRKSTNNTVKEFRQFLIDFHSQRDQQSLFDEDTQLLYLDNFANLMGKRELFYTHLTQWREADRKYAKYKQDIQKNQDKIALYQYQIDELETAGLSEPEEATLDTEYRLLTNAKEILDIFLALAADLFNNEGNTLDTISYYKKRLETFQEDSPTIKNTLDSLIICTTALDEVAAYSRRIDTEIAIDEERLTNIESRLKVIHDLKNKYRRDVPQILEFLSEMKTYVATFASDPQIEAEMKAEIGKLQTKTTEIANELHANRMVAATQFQAKIIESLRQLAINEADFSITVEKLADNVQPVSLDSLTSTGYDRVKYMFSANKGAALQELKATISGGELSRLLLVIKSIIAKKIPEHTILFDEIDSGIGGNTALKLARFIKELALSHQIVDISHLPQIAAMAENHFKIEKVFQNNRTIITLTRLNMEERQKEIARMLAGTLSDVAMIHAAELLLTATEQTDD